MDVSGHMHVNATVRPESKPVPRQSGPDQGRTEMPSFKSLATTAAIALAVVVAYDKYGNRG